MVASLLAVCRSPMVTKHGESEAAAELERGVLDGAAQPGVLRAEPMQAGVQDCRGS